MKRLFAITCCTPRTYAAGAVAARPLQRIVRGDYGRHRTRHTAYLSQPYPPP